MNVRDFLCHLNTAPPGLHTLPPPALPEEFDTLMSKHGLLPQFILAFWSSHNGFEYCVRAMPLLWFFPILPNPEDLWATNQSIIEYTSVWRESFNRKLDWVIGTWNDGRILVLSGDNIIEWDSNLKLEVGEAMSFYDWFDRSVREGIVYLEE